MSDLLHFFCLFACGGHWCYQSQKYELPNCEEPRRWYLINNTCKESKQSPINIVTKNVIYDDSLKPLNFEGYDVKGSSKWSIENNGHTVKVTFSTTPKIGGGGLKEKYKAVELHFHWGVKDINYLPGSEHSIDGEKTAMEVVISQAMHHGCCGQGSKPGAEALGSLEQQLHVKTRMNNPAHCTSSKQYFCTVCPGNVGQMDPLPLFSLLPNEEDLARYYRYTGSLTTPDCHEGVIWTVFEKPVALSLAQVSQFSVLHFGGNNSTYMAENFRPVQPLNDRSIYWSGASLSQPSAWVLMLLSVLTYILSSL
ncbi:CAH4 anhydrase, partial [Nothocercus nigrocapillus]|nr:CAH4 anhydrase [Nothocercus nigrocapillus]